ncbi:MAG: hypothetical protein AB7O96_12310 [Pseudobdellovibrionaceae bacterium]
MSKTKNKIGPKTLKILTSPIETDGISPARPLLQSQVERSTEKLNNYEELHEIN